MPKMNSYENNYLVKNGPESPSILSVNPHAIPTVSAKMAMNQSPDKAGESSRHNTITYDHSMSPVKNINNGRTPRKSENRNKKLPPQRSMTEETAVTNLSHEKDAHTE